MKWEESKADFNTFIRQLQRTMAQLSQPGQQRWSSLTSASQAAWLNSALDDCEIGNTAEMLIAREHRKLRFKTESRNPDVVDRDECFA